MGNPTITRILAVAGVLALCGVVYGASCPSGGFVNQMNPMACATPTGGTSATCAPSQFANGVNPLTCATPSPVAPNGFPGCTTLSGTTITLNPTNTTYPVTECYNLVLSGNTTITTFASGGAPVASWTAHINVTQPSGGHSYTLALSAGSGEALVYPVIGGCVSLPTMPTGTGHSLLLDLFYNTNPSSPEIDVLACPTTGS